MAPDQVLLPLILRIAPVGRPLNPRAALSVTGSAMVNPPATWRDAVLATTVLPAVVPRAPAVRVTLFVKSMLLMPMVVRLLLSVTALGKARLATSARRVVTASTLRMPVPRALLLPRASVPAVSEVFPAKPGLLELMSRAG